MIEGLAIAAIVLGTIPVVNTVFNLFLLRAPPAPAVEPSVSILIPARNEQRTIGTCVRAALASQGATIEVIVLDDGSTDTTAEIVKSLALRDPRLRLETAPPLPQGWKGKPHACYVLAGHARYDHLLFVDADVTLAPDAAARLAGAKAELVSGVPRQILGGIVESAVVPMINSLLYGYLPVAFMRALPLNQALTAACGQLLMVRTASYRACGGHAEVADAMHDGMRLARHFRARGFPTDLVDATPLARCRMYETATDVWRGFAKNATEGMARPLALPVWTALLAGGWLLPMLLVVLALTGTTVPLALPLAALLVVQYATRAAQAAKCGEPARTILLHPLGIVLTLAIQWSALIGYYRGSRVEWRGRSYRPQQ